MDDHRSFAEALTFAVGRIDDIEALNCAYSVEDALVAVHAEQPDVVIIDWQLRGVDGVEGTRRIKSARPNTAVILVTGHAAPGLERVATLAGASAVLPKESPIADIVDAVRRCAGREPSSATGSVGRHALTPREIEVLSLLASGKDTPTIAAELYLSVHTVRGYVKDLCRKFSAHSQLELVATARQAGLLRT